MLSDRQLVLCELLVTRCLGHGDTAAKELVSMFQRQLLFYVRRMVSSEQDAWDLLQETWLAVFRSLPSLRKPRAFPAYLYAIARNKSLGYLRKRRIDPVQLTSQEVVLDSVWEPNADDWRAADIDRVRVALDELPLVHRDVLTLHFLDDLSIYDTAAVLGIPPGTVKSRIFHAKQALRSLLQQP